MQGALLEVYIVHELDDLVLSLGVLFSDSIYKVAIDHVEKTLVVSTVLERCCTCLLHGGTKMCMTANSVLTCGHEESRFFLSKKKRRFRPTWI